LWVAEIETVVVDELLLSLQPLGPAVPADLREVSDWSWAAIVARVKAAAEDRSRTTGTTVPAGLILSAAELVDLLIEGAAQANVRDVDLAAFVNLPAVALAAVGEAWSHVAERVRE